jgi:D-aspartate ligase
MSTFCRRFTGPGAVVIGGDYQGLGIVRSLGRRGIDVLVLDDERSIGRYSRFASGAVTVADLRDEQTTVNTLLDLGSRHQLDGWVLFPTREETVVALSRNRERLLERFHVPTPPWEVIRWAWDKRNTYQLAGELGIATPRTWRVADVADLEAIDGQPPFAVKPAIKEDFVYATGRKAWRADTRSELARRVRDAAQLIGVEQVLVQELIPGGGDAHFSYCAFFRDKRTRAGMVVRRLRQHPPLFGRASTYVQTIEHPELEELSERFLSRIDYYGLVEIEYKYDARVGQLKLLDVNARTWGYHGLGQHAGVDFPYLLYADQLSRPLPDDLRATSGMSWVRLATDLPTAAVQLARGALDWHGYLRSLRSADMEAVFSRDDPMPALAELALLPYLAVKRGF